MQILQIISGFTQHEGEWNGGLELKEKMLAEFDAHSGLSVRVRYDVWNADWAHIARQFHLLRLRYFGDTFSVAAFAYSWGVGNGLAHLARELDRYGIPIDAAVICDGIYRHWYHAGNWRLLIGDTRIRLPDNVKYIDGFYQRVSLPMGKKPLSDNGKFLSWTQLQYPHVEMDDSPEWHQRSIEVARELVATSVVSRSSVPAGAPDSVAVITRKKNGQT